MLLSTIVNVCIEYEKPECFKCDMLLATYVYTSDGGSNCPASIALHSDSGKLMAIIATDV